MYGDQQLRCETAIAELVDFCNTNNAYPLIFAGDLFHKANMPTDLLLAFEQFINSLKFRGNVIVLGGNHERTHGGNSSLQAVKWPKRVELIVSKPVIRKIHGKSWMLLPYIHSRMPELLEAGVKRGIKNVITHLLLDGAFSRIKLASDILNSHFAGYRIAILGDVHGRQTLRIPNGKLYYSGNLVNTCTHDIGNRQGFISFIGGKLKYIDIMNVEPIKARDDVSEDDVKQQHLDLEKILTADLPLAATLNAQDCMEFVRRAVGELTSLDSSKKSYLVDFETANVSGGPSC